MNVYIYHKNPPNSSILSQMYAVHPLTSNISNICFNIPCKPVSYKWSPPWYTCYYIIYASYLFSAY
jgi:hypothetical protein